MRFRESSGLVLVLTDQPGSQQARELFRAEPAMLLWWGSTVECWSALACLRRDGILSPQAEAEARRLLATLLQGAFEVQPPEELRRLAFRCEFVPYEPPTLCSWRRPSSRPATLLAPTRRWWCSTSGCGKLPTWRGLGYYPGERIGAPEAGGILRWATDDEAVPKPARTPQADRVPCWPPAPIGRPAAAVLY